MNKWLGAHARRGAMTSTSRADIERWVAAYEKLWRTPGVERLGELFTEGARYQPSPYENPIAGLAAIARMWEAERAGADETFAMKAIVVAKEGETAVVRVEVAYGSPIEQEYRDLWIIRFAPDGRCQSFEEWPFWPGKGRTASDAS
jgi:hypothetical protein